MLKNMKINTKLIAIFLLIGLIPLGVIGWVSLDKAKQSLSEKSFAQLTSLREAKSAQIESYFNFIQGQVLTFSNDRMIIDAMNEFKSAFGSVAEGAALGLSADFVVEQQRQELSSYYQNDFSREYAARNNGQTSTTARNYQTLDKESVILQHRYISDNPHPLGSKDALADAGDGSQWSQLHGKYHPHIRAFLQEFGYYDIFLCDPETGDIVYSVYKELDFTTSLIDGPYANSGIGRVFQKANSSNQTETVAIDDFNPYAPSYEDQAGFIASPIVENGKKIGVLIFQMPIDRINDLMTYNHKWEENGLGASGETYLVGADLRMRSASRFLIEDKESYLQALMDGGISVALTDMIKAKNSSIGLQPVESIAAKEAQANKTGAQILTDYRGVDVLSAYTPLNIEGLDWVVLAEIDEEEAFAAIGSLQTSIFVLSFVMALVVAAVGWLFARSIARPITKVVGLTEQMNREFIQLTEVIEAIADNDLTQKVELNELESIGINSNDEIGALAKAIEGTLEARNKIGQSVSALTTNLSSMITDLDNNARELVSASTEIASSAEQMSRGAKDQTDQVTQVSTAIEEMTATIVESSRNAGEATKGAQGAAETAGTGGKIVNDTIQGMQRIADVVRESAESIGQLAKSADQIGEIIGVIDDIADQTNLLALNAAIEAARAGEQGRGFAVVADEVRKLAERTGKATGEITGMIKGIQSETKEAVGSMETGISEVDKGRELADKAGSSLTEIVNLSQSVQDMIAQIATAAEEQSTAAEQISKNVENVASIAKESATGAEQSASAAEQLNRQAEGLQKIVAKFKVS